MTASPNDIEACICTVNEAANIRDCLEALRQAGIADVRVVDGGSTDDTAALARQAGAAVLATGQGLASQRQAGIDACEKPFLLFVDADDRLDPQCPAVLLRQMLEDGYDALQARLRVLEPRSYWQRGMDALSVHCICRPGPSTMVGRPALYRIEALRAVGMDTDFDGVGNEDAALSIRMERAGRRQGVGLGISRRRHPETLAQNMAAWRKYGRGDARLLRRYPEKWRNVLGHLLYTYPVRRALELLRRGQGVHAFYPVCVGLARFAAMVQALLRSEAATPRRTPKTETICPR